MLSLLLLTDVVAVVAALLLALLLLFVAAAVVVVVVVAVVTVVVVFICIIDGDGSANKQKAVFSAHPPTKHQKSHLASEETTAFLISHFSFLMHCALYA